jgi:ABC-type uncharacterized transport system permease subunit
MTKNILAEGAYPGRKPLEAMPRTRTSSRMTLASGFIVILLLSLGLWWAVWSAFSSLIFG